MFDFNKVEQHMHQHLLLTLLSIDMWWNNRTFDQKKKKKIRLYQFNILFYEGNNPNIYRESISLLLRTKNEENWLHLIGWVRVKAYRSKVISKHQG